MKGFLEEQQKLLGKRVALVLNIPENFVCASILKFEFLEMVSLRWV